MEITESRLFRYFLLCWKYHTITEEQLKRAVELGYITQEEYEIIVNTPR